MNHRLKTLGLVLASIFAMSALGVSAASAATAFHVSNAPVNLTAAQTVGHVFTSNVGTVTCTTTNLHGTQTSLTSETMTLTPTGHPGGCKASGFINVTVDINGCAYKFNISGTAEIECPVGKKIEITIPGCTISIGPQHIASGTTYTTVGTSPNRHITTHVNWSGITYTECGPLRHNGTTKGSFTLKPQSGEMWVS